LHATSPKSDFKHRSAIGKLPKFFENAIIPVTLRKFLNQYPNDLEIIAGLIHRQRLLRFSPPL